MENNIMFKTNTNEILRILLQRNYELELNPDEIFHLATAQRFLQYNNKYSNKESIEIDFPEYSSGNYQFIKISLIFNASKTVLIANQFGRDYEGEYNNFKDHLVYPFPDDSEIKIEVINFIFAHLRKIALIQKPKITSSINQLTLKKSEIKEKEKLSLQKKLIIALDKKLPEEKSKKLQEKISSIQKEIEKLKSKEEKNK